MAMVDYYRPLRLNQVDSSLQEEIKQACGVDVELCLECGKCTGGCSNAHIFDLTPRKIVQWSSWGTKSGFSIWILCGLV